MEAKGSSVMESNFVLTVVGCESLVSTSGGIWVE